MKKLLSIVSVLLLLTGQFVGLALANNTTYYVDAYSGNDTNTGLQPWLAFQTEQKVSNTTMNPGDRVAFHCGQHFRSTSPTGNAFNGGLVYGIKVGAVGAWTGTAANPVTLTSYGDCPKDQPAWIDATVCRGLNTGPCAGQTAVNWTFVSGTTWKTADTVEPMEVLIDGEGSSGWPTLFSATCLSGTCLSTPHGSVIATPSGNLPLCASNFVYSAGDACSNGIGQWYSLTSGTSGAGVPTCFSGTCAAWGTVTPTFRGPSQGRILAMQPGSWYYDGQFLYISMRDASNPSVHVVEASETYYGLWVNESTTEMNFITVDHLGFRGGCNPIWIANGSGTQPLGQVLKNSYIYQAGTANVDTGNFCNSYTFSGATTTGTPGPIIESNVAEFSTHGGITLNQNSNAAVVRNNWCGHNGHGCFDNPVGAGSGHVNAIFDNNKAHDLIPNLFSTGPIPGTPAGYYAESCSGCLFTNNLAWNVIDPTGTTTAAAFWLFGGSGNTISNNVTDNVAYGFIEQNSGTTGLVVKNNVWRITPNPQAQNYVYSIADLVPTGTFQGNYITPNQGMVFAASRNSVAKTLAQWQALGFDTAPMLDLSPREQFELFLAETTAYPTSAPVLAPNFSTPLFATASATPQNAVGCNDTSVAITGALTSETCSISAAGVLAAADANSSQTCYVSAANTVQIHSCTHVALTGASQSFNIRVFYP